MRHLTAAVVVLCALLATPSPPVHAQTSEELQRLRQAVEALTERQQRVEQDLQEIKALLRSLFAGPPSDEPRNVVFPIAGEPVRGDGAARLVLVEFTDYQCPFCARHLRETWPQIQKDYVVPGKLRYVVRDFPLEALHPHAFKAAEAARCAGEHGKFWEMHDLLFANQAALDASALPGYAGALGLDVTAFRQCLDAGRHAARVRRDMAEGEKAGVRGTPTFFLGVAEPDGSVRALRVIRGAQGASVFKAAIEAGLATLK